MPPIPPSPLPADRFKKVRVVYEVESHGETTLFSTARKAATHMLKTASRFVDRGYEHDDKEGQTLTGHEAVVDALLKQHLVEESVRVLSFPVSGRVRQVH